MGAGVLDRWAGGVGARLPFIATTSTPAPSPTAATRETATIFALLVCSHGGIIMEKPTAPVPAADHGR